VGIVKNMRKKLCANAGVILVGLLHLSIFVNKQKIYTAMIKHWYLFFYDL